MVIRIYVFLGLAALGFSPQARAWGELGHKITGEIAEQLLARHPDDLRAVQTVSGLEPLSISAIWPDLVRNDKRYSDFDPYHFVDVPQAGTEVADKSALTILKKYPQLIADPKTPHEAKVVALRYLIHVIGDIHQPLHTGRAVDLGGNLCMVKWPDGSRATTMNLHSVWDTSLVELLAERKTTGHDPAFREMAKFLIEKHPEVVNGQAGEIDQWIQESRDSVAKNVYPKAAQVFCKKSVNDKYDESAIHPLDSAYIENALPSVELGLIKAGVRIAATLKKILLSAPRSNLGDEEMLKLLKLTTSGK